MTKTPEDLKPCPFCGGEAKIHQDTVDSVGAIAANGGFYVGHGAGHAKGCRLYFGGYFPSEEQAAKTWNTRPAPATNEQVEALHSKIDMDIEDELDDTITIAESKLIGMAVRKTINQRGLINGNSEVAWKPIETAPKDGSRVVLWGIERGFQKEPIAFIGFYDCNTSYTNASWRGYEWKCQPTHWMPLPAAPTIKNAGE